MDRATAAHDGVGGVVALAGVAVIVLALAAPGPRRLSAAMYRSVSVGTAESMVTQRFGSPASTDASAVSGGGRSLGCLVYQADSSTRGWIAYLFCFDGGRLRVKTRQ